ncbi:MAG: DUF192 domain-containing protein [Spirochaetes bacterium]|nr:DUF192 domain-containing protein [Spirochaetota bacterium]
MMVLLSISLISTVLSCSSSLQEVPLRLGQEIFRVELAISPESRSKGLMYRTELPPNRGMLFVFETDQKPSFWMKNTLVPLSIAFIAKDGTIREIYDMTPGSLRPIESTYEVRFALEVPQGAFRRVGVDVGYRIEMPPEVLRYVK